MALSSISAYVVRAVTRPDSDKFLVNLQSGEQATEDRSACTKQRSTESVPSASETLPCQIAFHVFFRVMKACKAMEKESRPEIPLLAAHRAKTTCCGLKPLSAWQFASLGRREGIRVSAEFPVPREAPLLPAASKSKVSSGLRATKPAAEQLAAWGWHGSSCVLEQHLHPLG